MCQLLLRLSFFQVYEATSDKFVTQDKYFGRRLDADGLRKALVQFFASGGARRAGIIEAILERLRLLRKAIEQQDTFRFYSRYVFTLQMALNNIHVTARL
jgi:inositol-hexakisphosphate kinase